MACVDDDMTAMRMYNRPVTQAAIASTGSRESVRTAPGFPLGGLAALAIIVTIGLVAIRLSGGSGLENHRTGPFTFEAPAAWSVTDARAAWTGGSSYAVVGTVPVPAACLTGFFDINCYLAQKPPPSSVSIVLATSSPLIRTVDIGDYMGQVRAEGSRMEVGGFEAYRFDGDIAPNDYYRSDRVVSWLVLPNAEAMGGWVIDARVRGPGAHELMRDIERLVASMRIAP